MEFIGHKGAAMFDLWSIAHFLLGMAFGQLPATILARRTPRLANTSATLQKSNIWHQYFFITAFAYSWEALEFALEAGVAGPQIGFWLQGHENVLNRLISDPALVLLGFWFAGKHAPGMVWLSRIALVIWSWFFLAVLPHSMAYMG